MQSRSMIKVIAAAPILMVVCVLVLMCDWPSPQVWFVYALDDAYIHLAVAKNLAESFTWGFNPGEFSSPTSSLLWPVLLMPFAWLDVGQYLPLIFNMVAAAILAVVIHRELVRYCRLDLSIGFATLIMLVALVPSIALSGMEHVLHAALTILFLSAIFDQSDDAKLPALYALLLGAIRYEGLIAIAFGMLYLISTRRLRVASFIAGAGVLPMILFAGVSVYNEWPPIANSVLLKSGGASIVERVEHNMLGSWPLGIPQLIFVLQVPLLLLLLRNAQLHRRELYWSAAFGFVLFGHLLGRAIPASSNLYTFRYELYLVVLGLLSTGGLLWRAIRDRARWKYIAVSLSLLVLGYILIEKRGLERAYRELGRTRLATHEIYSQQWNMATLAQTLPKGTIAVNDLGMMAYRSGHRIVDVFGLGDKDVRALKRANRFSTLTLDSLTNARQVNYAILYQPANFELQGPLPRSWVLVGQWAYANTTILGGDTVNFCALSPAAISDLKDAFNRYPTP